jgi:hypothetical protein
VNETDAWSDWTECWTMIIRHVELTIICRLIDVHHALDELVADSTSATYLLM